jgi:hypothetical protein
MSFLTEILLLFEKGILLPYGHRLKLFRLVGSLCEAVEATSEPLFLIAKVQSGSGSSLTIIAGLAAESEQLIQTTRDLRQMAQQ